MFEWPQNPEDPLYMQALFVKRWAEQGCIEGSFLRGNAVARMFMIIYYARNFLKPGLLADAP